jgi:hypothetical protein
VEFYAFARIEMSPMVIQRDVHISSLTELCRSIEKVLSQQGERGEIYCIWGEFKVHRELIRQGVRFTLPGCPNTLQWTITTAVDEPGMVRVHCTIEQTRHDSDFIESLQQFVEDWKHGLESKKVGMRKGPARAAADCMPIYG